LTNPEIRHLKERIAHLEKLLELQKQETDAWKHAAWKLHTKTGSIAEAFAKITRTSADVAKLEG